MYVFAMLILLGLVVAKFTDLVHAFYKMSSAVRLAFVFLAGLGICWAADLSALYYWNIAPRELWMGPVATGLAIGALAAVWHQVLVMVSSYSRRLQDQATEIETRIPRAA